MNRRISRHKCITAARQSEIGIITVCHFKGSAYEMGYQHGALLKQKVIKGVLPFYANPINGRRKNRSLADRLFSLYLNIVIYRPAKKSQPREMLEHIRGIADGSGLGFRTVFRAYHHPIVGLVLIPRLIKKMVGRFAKTGISLGACSSFAVRNSLTVGGELLIGRNLDYEGIESFPANRAVCFYNPDTGYKYVEITTAGLCAPTGFNEKGLVLCGHNLFLDHVHPRGWSFLTLSTMILRKAGNIKQAVSLIKTHKRGFCGALLLAEPETRRAVVVEFNSRQVAVTPMREDRLVLTNTALTPQLQQVDFLRNFCVSESAKARYLRLRQLIRSHEGTIDPERAACFLGDHIHQATDTERSVSNILAAPNNISSVIFEPERMQFWVAAGQTPASNNLYIRFDFKSISEWRLSALGNPKLTGYHFLDNRKKSAMRIFRRAHVLYEEHPDRKPEIKTLLSKAMAQDKEEIIFYHILCKLYIHDDEIEAALFLMQKTFSISQSVNEKAHSLLLIGICYDLLDKRNKAVEFYEGVLILARAHANDIFPVNMFVRAFAEKYIRRAFTRKNKNHRSVAVSFSLSSGLE